MMRADTNKVMADARWLYLNLEKTIHNYDPTQAFVFNIVNSSFTENNNILTDIYCKNSADDINCWKDGQMLTTNGYKGNQIIQIIKRGLYEVSEKDWAKTDYDVSNSVLTAADIDFGEYEKYIFNSYVSNKGEQQAVLQDISTSSGVRGFYLPRVMFKSTAFPLWAAESADLDNNGNVTVTTAVYPTVSAHNDESDYAWLSSQTNVENSFNIANSKSASKTASASKGTEQAVETTTETVTVKKDEGEEE